MDVSRRVMHDGKKKLIQLSCPVKRRFLFIGGSSSPCTESERLEGGLTDVGVGIAAVAGSIAGMVVGRVAVGAVGTAAGVGCFAATGPGAGAGATGFLAAWIPTVPCAAGAKGASGTDSSTSGAGVTASVAFGAGAGSGKDSST